MDLTNIGSTSLDSLPVGNSGIVQQPVQAPIQTQQNQSQQMQLQIQQPIQQISNVPNMPVSGFNNGQENMVIMQPNAHQLQGQTSIAPPIDTSEGPKITMDAAEIQRMRNEDPAIQQKQMNQFITGLQQATASGLTSLPVRDIPTNQEFLARDMQMKPNYVPQAPPNMSDYISEHKSNEDMIKEYARRQQKDDRLDELYNQLQVPILLAVLYFIFQLPVVRKNIFKFLPSLFNSDGNPNLYGYVANSLMFGTLYFVLTKGLNYFSI